MSICRFVVSNYLLCFRKYFFYIFFCENPNILLDKKYKKTQVGTVCRYNQRLRKLGKQVLLRTAMDLGSNDRKDGCAYIYDIYMNVLPMGVWVEGGSS